MMVLDERPIQRAKNQVSSFVYLPKFWLERNKLKRKSKVLIAYDDDLLIIVPAKSRYAKYLKKSQKQKKG